MAIYQGNGNCPKRSSPSSVHGIPLKAFKRPHDQKTIKSFLGLCTYYGAFVPNFAELAVPLNKLLIKGIHFDWSEECEEMYQGACEDMT